MLTSPRNIESIGELSVPKLFIANYFDLFDSFRKL